MILLLLPEVKLCALKFPQTHHLPLRLSEDEADIPFAKGVYTRASTEIMYDNSNLRSAKAYIFIQDGLIEVTWPLARAAFKSGRTVCSHTEVGVLHLH